MLCCKELNDGRVEKNAMTYTKSQLFLFENDLKDVKDILFCTVDVRHVRTI